MDFLEYGKTCSEYQRQTEDDGWMDGWTMEHCHLRHCHIVYYHSKSGLVSLKWSTMKNKKTLC